MIKILLLLVFCVNSQAVYKATFKASIYPVKRAEKNSNKYIQATNKFEELNLLGHNYYITPNKDSLIHIKAYYNFNKKEDNSTIIYFHGNGTNVDGLVAQRWFHQFKELGFNYVAFDYPKYGQSEGSLNEKNNIEAGVGVINYIREKLVSNGKIIIVGRSLGAAVAAQTYKALEDKSDIEHLVLISGWYSAKDMVRAVLKKKPEKKLDHIVSGNKYETYEALSGIKTPLLIIHGDDDEVIPVSHAYKLEQNVKNASLNLSIIEGGKHSDIMDSPDLWNILENNLINGDSL